MAESDVSSDHGFSLPELLVAMAVLAILGGLLAESVRLARTMKAAAIHASDQMSEQAVADHFRRELRQVVRLYSKSSETNQLTLIFEGRSDRLEVLLPANLDVEVGGLLQVSFYTKELGSGDYALMTRRSPLINDNGIETGEGLLLLRTKRPTTFRYLSGKQLGTNDDQVWQSEWSVRDQLPIAIEVDIEGPSGMRRRQTLVVSLQIAQ